MFTVKAALTNRISKVISIFLSFLLCSVFTKNADKRRKRSLRALRLRSCVDACVKFILLHKYNLAYDYKVAV